MSDGYTRDRIVEEYGVEPVEGDFIEFAGIWYSVDDLAYCHRGSHWICPERGVEAEIDGESACRDCLVDFRACEEYRYHGNGCYTSKSEREQHGYPF